MSSPDGETWTGGTGPIQGALQGIAYGPTGGYVAVGVDNSNPANNIVIYQTSLDGVSWTGSAEMGSTGVDTLKTSITIDTLIDSNGSTGGPGQILTAGAAGGGLVWSSGGAGGTGPTGPTGPSISYRLGNNPYAESGNLITTTIGTAQTRIYEVGPITTTASTKLLIMANACFTSNNRRVVMTVGRATTSGAIAANSTNIVTNASPVTLPALTSSYYMAATSEPNTHESNTNGFAIDAPGAGTFYYTIWMSSDASHNYSEMTAVLTALQIT